jgi:hypothetical protein
MDIFVRDGIIRQPKYLQRVPYTVCSVGNLGLAIGRGIDSRNRVPKLHRLVGRYDNPMPTWFLAPIAGLKLPTLVTFQYVHQIRIMFQEAFQIWIMF